MNTTNLKRRLMHFAVFLFPFLFWAFVGFIVYIVFFFDPLKDLTF